MNTLYHPPDVLSLLSSQAGTVTGELLPQAVPQPEERTWIDLASTGRFTLGAAQERYGLPPEAMTYFLLHYQTAKLIHASPALFLVTFLAIPSLRHLFTTRELKICVTPTHVVTLCGPAGRVQPEQARSVSLLPGRDAGGVGRFLCDLLRGVVGSYETIVKTVEDRRLNDTQREERQRWHRRVEKFIRFLRDERVFLSNVAREGRKLFAAAESQQLLHLEEQVGVLARVAWDTTHPKKDEQGAVESVLSEKGDGDA